MENSVRIVCKSDSTIECKSERERGQARESERGGQRVSYGGQVGKHESLLSSHSCYCAPPFSLLSLSLSPLRSSSSLPLLVPLFWLVLGICLLDLLGSTQTRPKVCYKFLKRTHTSRQREIESKRETGWESERDSDKQLVYS